MHCKGRLPHTHPTNRHTRQVETSHHPGRFLAQILVTAALHDAKQGLVGAVVGGNTTLKPAMGALRCLLHIGMAGWIGRALIKCHCHISAKAVLNRHHPLWGELHHQAISGGFKSYPQLGDGIEAGQAKNLKAAGIGEHWCVPTHEAMQATGGGNNCLPRLQVQVKGVAEHHLRSGAAQLINADSLHRGGGTHGHKARRINNPMGGVKTAHAGFGIGALMQHFVAKRSGAAGHIDAVELPNPMGRQDGGNRMARPCPNGGPICLAAGSTTAVCRQPKICNRALKESPGLPPGLACS